MPSDDNSPHPRPPALRWLLLLLVVTVLLRVLIPARVIESFYSRWLFVGIRTLWDFCLGWLPVPLFYFFWMLIVGLMVRLVYQAYRLRKLVRSKRMIVAYVGKRVVRTLCCLLLFFLWAWGANYGRLPVETQLSFVPQDPDIDELRVRVYGMAKELVLARALITADTFALTENAFPENIEAPIRDAVAAALRADGYPAPGRPRGFELRPKGILLRWSTSGVYWPWAMQGNIDAGLHALQKPAVLAHELSHAYGFGDEGTCSFWAFLAAEHTENPSLHYALLLAYWRQLAGRLRYADPDGYLAWRVQAMDPGIRNDLEAIYLNSARYEDFAPVLRDATYTAYLHAQGISDGLLNYSRVIRLVEGYRADRAADQSR